MAAVIDGFIVGFDAGEFGGRAFWFSRDGSQNYALSLLPEPTPMNLWEPENVHALVRLGPDLLAFEGVAHMGLDKGKVLRFHRGDEGHWRATEFSTLPGAPEAVVQEAPDRWLVAVPKGVVRLGNSGQFVWLWSERYLGHLYPNSGVRLADGRVLVGMRHFVLQLTPAGSSYSVNVLIPPGCSVRLCECGP